MAGGGSPQKASTASGLDGVSRQDLLLLPDLLNLVLDTYAHAEATGVWPSQAMQAVITALEKRPDASRVEHYRPITIISLVYRVWSGIRAKQCMRHLLQFCDPRQNGCLPKRSAACVWYDTQANIELARRAGAMRHGIVTDIIEAFNCIPRPPVYALALSFGIPKKIVQGWQGAMHLLTRRFRVRGSVGPGVRSVTGFPDGCGMSCTAVVLLGISYHSFLAAQIPTLQASSYVDNLAGTSDKVRDVIQAARVLQQWADAWDLQFDKTVVWSTCPRARTLLRQEGMRVVLDGPDLGGHMQYALRRSNFGLIARISTFEPAWLRLGQSLAGYPSKLMAIKMAGWPATLHGSSMVHVGPRHFEQLRVQATKALRVAGPGMNSKLLLGFVEPPLADPEYFALWTSVCDLARLAFPDTAIACLNAAALCPGRPVPGPFGVVWTRLSSIGVHWVPETSCFTDDHGTWSPWLISKQELQSRLETQWQRAVAASLHHRHGFAGLQQVDVMQTRALLRQYGPDGQAILRVALTGRFYTQRELRHIGHSDQPTCPFCGELDGIAHRVEHCPMFQVEREQHLGPLRATFTSLAPVQKEHAWALCPQGFGELQTALLNIGWGDVDDLSPICDVGQFQHLFVDGSCLLPTVPHLRLSSWSVVLAAQDELFSSQILAAGHLPTIVQTSYRAEIFAVLRALQLVQVSNGGFCIWSDCAGVVARLQQYKDGGPQPGYLTNNCDLWRPVWQLMQEVKNRISIRKVAAHVDAQATEDLVHEWASTLNGVADGAAKQANLNRSESFWQLWNRTRTSYNEQLRNAQTCVDLHVAIGARATPCRQVSRDLEVRPQQQEPVRILCFSDVPDVPMPTLVARWGADYVSRLSRWLREVFPSAREDSPPVWISKVELFFGFLLSTEFLPPVYDAKRKLWLRNPHLVAATHRRVQWFAQNLGAVAKQMGLPLAFESKWPSSAALGGQHPCLGARFPVQLRASIDRYLLACHAQLRGPTMLRWRHVPLPSSCLR